MLEALCKHVQTFALVFVFETGAWSSRQLDLIQTLNMADLPLAPVSHLTALKGTLGTLGTLGTRRWHVSGTSEAHPRCSHRTTWHHSPPKWNPWKNHATGWLGLVLGGWLRKKHQKASGIFFQSLGGFLHMLRSFREDGNKHWQSLTVTLSVVKTSLLYSALICYSLRAAVADTLNPAA